MDRILFDECMSPKLVARARARGFEATHVSYLGKGSWQDYNLVDVILGGIATSRSGSLKRPWTSSRDWTTP